MLDHKLTEIDSIPAIYHVDLYRLDSVSAMDQEALGLKHAFRTGQDYDIARVALQLITLCCIGISLVEWSERLDVASVPFTRLDVLIEYDEQHDTERNVVLKPFGDRWKSN